MAKLIPSIMGTHRFSIGHTEILGTVEAIGICECCGLKIRAGVDKRGNSWTIEQLNKHLTCEEFLIKDIIE